MCLSATGQILVNRATADGLRTFAMPEKLSGASIFDAVEGNS